MIATSVLDGTNFWFNYIAAIGFASATIWGAVTFIHRRWIRQVTSIVSKKIDADFTNKIAEEVEHIYKETTHNGGGSMKDAIRRLESNTREGFDKLEKQQEQLERYIQKLDKALERHFGYHEGADE